MKKVIYFLLALALSISFKAPDEKVYVCHSSTSVAYHENKECRGLDSCKHEIIYITKKEAIENHGKRACKICY